MKYRYISYAVTTMLLVMSLISCSDDEKVSSQKKPQGQTQVQTQESSKEYVANVVPEKMTVHEKKQRFAYLVAPAVNEVHAELKKQYKVVSKSILDGEDAQLIKALKEKYRVTDDQDLLEALKPHPRSIALAQAAMESAWGTSRFFREANNIFGVWSFDENEPRIAASQKRGSDTIWLKKYPSIKAAVNDYYRVLARGSAFEKFRELKMETSDPYKLVKKLDRYSEKGDAYGKELAAMIRFNKFDTYYK